MVINKAACSAATLFLFGSACLLFVCLLLFFIHPLLFFSCVQLYVHTGIQVANPC